eukprot:XP_011619737.1 PREDICTED: Fanconi anemia-associated protein of 20 kDa [Takifugu rubripes]
MCDIHFKSKLKRRKTFVENQQGTRSPREAPNRNPTWQESPAIPESRAWGGPQAGTGESKESGSASAVSGSLFQNPEVGTKPPDSGNTFGDLLPDGNGVPKKSPLEPAVEILWALTLKAFLTKPENQHRYQVPELPQSPTEGLTSATVVNQDHRDNTQDVPPFPKSSSSPAQTDPPAEAAVTSQNIKTVSSHDHKPALPSSSSSSSSAASNSRVEQTSVCGPEPAAVLQRCPMCCLLFPSGFSQMDLDTHLALCLSEVRTDMTW